MPVRDGKQLRENCSATLVERSETYLSERQHVLSLVLDQVQKEPLGEVLRTFRFIPAPPHMGVERVPIDLA